MTRPISPLYRWQYLLPLLSAVLLWPMLVNGGAFYFPDTPAYIRGVDAALNRAIGWHSVWTQSAALPGTTVTAPVATGAISTVGGVPIGGKPVLLGRSVYYGIIPFTGIAVASSDWLTVLVQALVTGIALVGLVRHFIDPRQRGFGWACAACFALLAATSLPFFVSMLMPDFMAGISIVAAAVLVVGWYRESRTGRLLWFILALAAALMHSANILILLAIAGPGLLFAAVRHDSGAGRGGATLVAIALLGLAGEAVFTQAVTRITGAAPIRPPFVSARLIEDGPGLAYLDRNCPVSGFVLCHFRDRMPEGSDTFLWSADPRNGVFSATTPAIQRALSAEQMRFVIAVVRTFPLQSAIVMLRAGAKQMGLLSLAEFNYQSHGHLARVPPPVLREITMTRAYTRTMPVGISELMLWPSLLGSLAIIAMAFHIRAMRPVAGYGAVAVLGLLANDIVCGALSTPHDRYQARIVWILPLISFLILIRARYAQCSVPPPPNVPVFQLCAKGTTS